MFKNWLSAKLNWCQKLKIYLPWNLICPNINSFKVFNDFEPLIIFRKSSIVDVRTCRTKWILKLIFFYKISFQNSYIFSERYVVDLHTGQKMKFSIKGFFSKCEQICSFLWVWSHLLKKSLMENFLYFLCNDIFWRWQAPLRNQSFQLSVSCFWKYFQQMVIVLVRSLIQIVN